MKRIVGLDLVDVRYVKLTRLLMAHQCVLAARSNHFKDTLAVFDLGVGVDVYVTSTWCCKSAGSVSFNHFWLTRTRITIII